MIIDNNSCYILVEIFYRYLLSLHMLWYVVLMNFDDVANGIEEPRCHFVEECDSFEEALNETIKLIKK